MSRDDNERRRHVRVKLQKTVVGILNSEEPELIGSITDMSLGGVKYTYNELRTALQKPPISSVDLISENHYLLDLPCEEVWDIVVDSESDSKLTNLRQCGFKFGELTPNQVFLLRSFMNRCASPGIDRITPTTFMADS